LSIYKAWYAKIESPELNQVQQFAVVDQLRRAITEEIDDVVRRDIFDMLRNLMSKPNQAD
jgi:hypothetical protein